MFGREIGGHALSGQHVDSVYLRSPDLSFSVASAGRSLFTFLPNFDFPLPIRHCLERNTPNDLKGTLTTAA